MDREPSDNQRGALRKHLGALTAAGIRVLSGLARRLGVPAALASVPVSAVMLTRLQTVSLDQPLEDAAQLLVAGRRAEVTLVDHGQPVGVVTRDDLAVAVQVLGPHAPVGEAHRHHVIPVTPSDSLVDVLERLRGTPESVAVVIDRGEPVGVLTVERLAAYARELG